MNKKTFSFLSTVIILIISATFYLINTFFVPSTIGTSQSSSDQPISFVSGDLFSVVDVVDGDTIKVNINGTKETIRFIGINTPETVDPKKPVECYGKQASDKMKEILNGKNVRLEADSTQGNKDKYGRLLRYVYSSSGLNVNLQMVQEGYAYEYTYDKPYKYQAEFKKAEANAKEFKIGLWGVCPSK